MSYSLFAPSNLGLHISFYTIIVVFNPSPPLKPRLKFTLRIFLDGLL